MKSAEKTGMFVKYRVAGYNEVRKFSEFLTLSLVFFFM